MYLLYTSQAHFPFQLWMMGWLKLRTLREDITFASFRVELVAYLAIIAVFTVASSPTFSVPSKTVRVKSIIIVAIATVVFPTYPEKVNLVGLFIEATLAGMLNLALLDVWTSLGAPLDSRRRAIWRGLLLVATGFLHLLLPRILGVSRLTTHLWYKVDPRVEKSVQDVAAATPIDHTFTIAVNIIVKELLVFLLPHTFARLAVVSESGFGTTLQAPPPTRQLAAGSYRLHGLHYFVSWFFLYYVWDVVPQIPWILLHMPTVLRQQSDAVALAADTVAQPRRFFSKAVRLALLGRTKQCLNFVRNGWQALDTVNIALFLTAVGIYFWFWAVCLVVVGMLLRYLW